MNRSTRGFFTFFPKEIISETTQGTHPRKYPDKGFLAQGGKPYQDIWVSSEDNSALDTADMEAWLDLAKGPTQPKLGTYLRGRIGGCRFTPTWAQVLEVTVAPVATEDTGMRRRMSTCETVYCQCENCQWLNRALSESK